MTLMPYWSKATAYEHVALDLEWTTPSILATGVAVAFDPVYNCPGASHSDDLFDVGPAKTSSSRSTMAINFWNLVRFRPARWEFTAPDGPFIVNAKIGPVFDTDRIEPNTLVPSEVKTVHHRTFRNVANPAPRFRRTRARYLASFANAATFRLGPGLVRQRATPEWLCDGPSTKAGFTNGRSARISAVDPVGHWSKRCWASILSHWKWKEAELFLQ